MEFTEENYFGRNTLNICKLVGFADCNFKLNKSNAKEVVNHFVSEHDCIRSKSHEFQMKLSNFKKGMKPLKSSNHQIHIWTPIIANLNKKQGALLIMAFLNGTFGILTLYLPCKYDENWTLTASPVEIKFITMTGESSKYSFIQSATTLAKLDEFGLSNCSFCFKSSSLNPFVEGDGSLLVDCQVWPVDQSKTESSAVAAPWKVELGRTHAIPLQIQTRQIKNVSKQVKSCSKKALTTLKTRISFLWQLSVWTVKVLFMFLIVYELVNSNWSPLYAFLFKIFEYFEIAFDSKIFYIAHKGDLGEFQAMLKSQPSLTNYTFAGHENHSLLQIALLDNNNKRGLSKVFVLEQMGADLDHRNSQNHTALIIAAGTNHASAVEFFLRKGLNPNAQDGEGFTPFEHVMIFNNQFYGKITPQGWDTLKVLFRYGADCRFNKKSVVTFEQCTKWKNELT